MPAVHTCAFQVRHYECDLNGYLSHANHLRYMEEAAFEASAAVGYDKARYEAMGFLWLARATEIEYLAPIRYNDTVEITTWVQDFRRVRSWRVYEFRIAGSEKLVARAMTDWVYLNQKTLFPSAIPPEMVTAFAPDGDVETVERRNRFPKQPPPPGVYVTHKHPEWRDIDTAQHVNNAVYLDIVADLAIQAARHYGWPHTRMLDAGFFFAPRSHRIEYTAPAKLGDELELATWISDVSDSSYARHFTVSRAGDGTLLTRIYSQWTAVDIHTGNTIPIPAGFVDDFAGHIALS
jgi:acyl-CoA thioester hydrolase